MGGRERKTECKGKWKWVEPLCLSQSKKRVVELGCVSSGLLASSALAIERARGDVALATY